MTNKELSKQRWKVINDYPDCPFHIGQILYAEDNGVVKLDDHSSARLEAYPYLFQKLVWFQERELKDLPLFIKIDKHVFKVIEWRKHEDVPRTFYEYPVLKTFDEQMCWQNFRADSLPATEEEYNAYINQQP